MKKILAMLLAVGLVVSMLAGCGGGADADNPNLGVYKIQSLSGMTIEDLNDLLGEDYSEMITIELKAGGKGEMTVEGDGGKIKWSMDGDNITIEDASDSLTGTLVDGVMTLDFDGEEVVMVKAE